MTGRAPFRVPWLGHRPKKKSPASGALRYCAETGGVLFRDLRAPPNLMSNGTHGGHNTHLNWFVK
jgi:hypothetical protein